MTAAFAGLGLVTSFGIGPSCFFAAAMRGSGPARFRRVEPWPQPGGDRVVACVDMAAVAGALEGERLRTLNDETAMLLLAARGALADGEMTPAAVDPGGLGVVVSTRYAGLQDYAELFWSGSRNGRRVNPARGPQTGFNAPAAQVSIRLGAGGPNATFTNGSVAGFDALSWAIDAIDDGDASAMLVCGVDLLPPAAANLTSGAWSGAERGPRPFDFRRSGPVLAEAAVAILLEDERALLARGGRPRASVAGVATAFSPQGDAVDASARALRDAVAATPWPASAIGGCLAGANGSVAGDACEAFAIHDVFGPNTPVAAIKGSTGEPHGAGALIQLAAAGLSLQRRALPPTAGLTELDPALPRLAVGLRPTPLEAERPLIVLSCDPEGAAGAAVVHAAEGKG